MKLQGETVHAIPKSGGLRTIVEHVTEMTAAAAAMDFGAQHSKGPVLSLADRVFERLIEARPAGAALEFRFRGEQRQGAAGAGESALPVLLGQRARPPAFRAFLAPDLALPRRPMRPP